MIYDQVVSSFAMTMIVFDQILVLVVILGFVGTDGSTLAEGQWNVLRSNVGVIYPLRNHITLEIHNFGHSPMGKLTISMAIFRSYIC